MRTILMILMLTSVMLADMEYGSFVHDGITRSYITYIPDSVQTDPPLVLVLHGYDHSASALMEDSSMPDVADIAGFITCFPQADQSRWNSGISTIGWPTSNTDDVGFLSELMDTLHADYGIDLDKIYVCGHSNGGIMTFRLVCEINDRIAKAASVSGTLTDATIGGCDSVQAIPMLLMHGTADHVVPYYGGITGATTAEETLGYWLGMNNCVETADTLALPDTDPDDGCTTDVIIYSDCDESLSVVFYKIHGAGHSWPRTDFIADVELWKFFNSDSFALHGVWVHDLILNATYLEPELDTLIVSAAITNTDDHAYAAYAIIRNMDSTLVDSFQLYDDGLHNDGVAEDGVAGASIPAPTVESLFYLQTTTQDLDDGSYLGPHDLEHFTTIGPLVIESLEQLHPADGAIPTNSSIYFYLYFHNLGLTVSAQDLTIEIQPADSNITLINGFESSMVGDLSAGDVGVTLSYLGLRTKANCVEGTPLYFDVQIKSQGVTFWEDMGVLLGYVGVDDLISQIPEHYELEQNYPNPFNPTTTISYSLPEQSSVKLTVFDIRGQEVTTRLNADKPPGNYKVQWNGLDQQGNPVSTGVYFCRLQAGDYSKTIKMVYLR